jgi:hypothetical protein
MVSSKRKIFDSAAEISNERVNLKVSVSDTGVLTFAPVDVKKTQPWNIKLFLEDALVSGIDIESPTRISVDHEGSRIRELVENVEAGIEHSFSVRTGPATPFSLRLGVATNGISKIAEYDSNLCFWGEEGPVFVYQNLVVRDATGRQVKSNMFWQTEGPRIILDVLESPIFPIVIDPLVTTPGKALLAFKLPENLLSMLGPGAKVVDVSCSSSIANFAESSPGSDDEASPEKRSRHDVSVSPRKLGPSKLGLPAFSLHLPSFRLPRSWLKSLYGGTSRQATPVPRGQSALHSHPSLPYFDIGLDWEGRARFDSKSGLELVVSPPDLQIDSPELLTGAKLHLLRGKNADIGISFDKQSSRHFFFLSKPLSGKFSLQFKLEGSDKIEYNVEHNYLVVSDQGGNPRLVYSSPLLRLPNGQTSVQRVEWDPQSLSLSLSLSSDLASYPSVLAFPVAGKRPDGPFSFSTSFPSLRFGVTGEVAERKESDTPSPPPRYLHLPYVFRQG